MGRQTANEVNLQFLRGCWRGDVKDDADDEVKATE